MALESLQKGISDSQVLDKVVHITSSALVTTYYLSVYEKIVRVTTDDTNAITVYLPYVAEAVGQMFIISLETDGGVDLTVASRGDCSVAISDTFADAKDRCIYFSDGVYWHKIASSGI